MKKTYYQLLCENKDYRPKSRIFTSNEEIEMLDRHFGLSEMPACELHNLRDMAVLYYDDLANEKTKDGKRTDEYMQVRNAMMSLTTVIDLFIYRKEGTV